MKSGNLVAGNRRRGWIILIGLTLIGAAGCDVPGVRGKGIQLRRTNAASGRGYWLYLPRHFARDRRWPLVVTLHGMKPFDNSTYQIHEWQPTADQYGLVVVAPDLVSPDLLGEFPLQNPHNVGLLKDELAVLNILEEMCTEAPVRTEAILLTSWSSGGYIAHYMMNRHSNLFAALAARESNFQAHLLDPGLVDRYAHKPVLVFYGQNDFSRVKKEAIEAAEWYRRHDFALLEESEIPGLGHQRRPGIAAEFFARYAALNGDRLEIAADPVIGDAPVRVKLGVRLPAGAPVAAIVRWYFGPERRYIGEGQRIEYFIDQPGYHRIEARAGVAGALQTARLILSIRPSEHRTAH